MKKTKKKLKITIPSDDELNDLGVFLGDIFLLNYCGINVFFRVCKTYKNSVCLYEIKTKEINCEGKKCIALSKKLVANKEPFIIDKKYNTQTKSNYEVYPIPTPYEDGGVVIPIEITPSCPLFLEALKNENEYPMIGTAYAYKIKDYIGCCWELKNNERKLKWENN